MSLIMLVKRKTDVKFTITPSAFVLETLTQQRLTVIREGKNKNTM